MADPENQAAPVEAAVPEVVSAAPVEIAVPEVVVTAVPESAVVEPSPAPVGGDPAAGTVPEKSALDAHTDKPTMLELAGKQEEPKAVDAKAPEVKPDVDKPSDGKSDEKPAVTEPVTYEEFKLPEGILADPVKIDAYKEVLAKNNIPQEAAQTMLDMHSGSLQEYANNLLQEQHRAFAKTRESWNAQVMADPQLGGSGHKTAMMAVARGRDALLNNPTNAEMNIPRAELENFLRITGAGDHPVFLKMLHNAARMLDEPAMPAERGAPPPNNGKPGPRRMSDIYDKR